MPKTQRPVLAGVTPRGEYERQMEALQREIRRSNRIIIRLKKRKETLAHAIQQGARSLVLHERLARTKKDIWNNRVRLNRMKRKKEEVLLRLHGIPVEKSPER